MKYPHIQQHDEKDCGAACLAMISEYYGLKLTIAKFRDLIKVDSQGANIYGLVTGAEEIELHADALEGTPDELFQGIADNEIHFPFIARIINEEMFEHYIVIYAIKNGIVTIGDPAKPKVIKMPIEVFKEQWQGQIVTFEPNEKFEKKNERKGSFSKFFRFITNQKKMISFVFVMSILVSFINISGSIVFEYVINSSMTTAEEEAAVCEDENCEEDHDHSAETSEGNEGKIEALIDSLSNKFSVIFQNINTVCISIILLYILKSVLQVMRGYLLALTAKKVDIPLTLNYYNHLVDLPASFYGTRKTGEFMSRFSDTAKIRDAISTATLTIMLDTIMAVACGIILFFMNHTLFLITIIIMTIYAIIMFAFKKPIKSVNHELMESDAQVTAYLKESIDGIETVKAYQYETNAKQKTEKLYTRLAEKAVKGSIIYNLQEVLVEFVASTGIIALLWSGTYLCIKDIISLGDLFTFYYLIGYFLDPVQNLINLQPELQTAIVAGERLNDILDAETEENENKKDIDSLCGDVELNNIDFRYGNRELVLKNVSMKFPKGKKIALVGESGCGKTTLAKLMMSFYEPEKGNIIVNGTDLASCSSKSIRKHVAYISQDVFLFSDSIYNNLKMGNESITDDEIKEVCKLCMIDEFVKHMPLGYDTPLEENGNNLSGGQKQRIAIARALLRKPDIIIMDEATSNLDTITEESIKNTIDKISDKMTCIIIAHRLKTIKNCDYIYVMKSGKVVEEGTHDSLLKMNSVYSKYWNSGN